VPRKKKTVSGLKEGQYPSVVVAHTPAGAIERIPVIAEVPKAERPVAPIKDSLLSSFILPTFDYMNINGKQGLDALILLCRMGAHRYETLRLFIIAWEDLHQPNLFAELYPELAFTEPSLEQCCDLAKISNEDFVGDVTRMIYYYGLESAKWQIHAGLGDVVRAAHDTARMVGKEGFQDRQLLLKAGGVVQEGPGTVVNVNNQVTTNQIAGLPKWEDSDKVVVEALQQWAPKELPEKSAVEAEPVQAIVEKEVENAP